ncbi:lipocalin family protein [Aequorivita viscosa]|nr:lipocalin family protein [Aequorivita viscosa]
MKIFKLFLFTALISLTVSCSSDDDSSTPANNGDIIGVWQGTAVDYRGTTTTTAQGQTITADYVGEAYDVDYTLTFTENPNKVISDGSYSIELTTTVNGQSTTQNVPNLEFLSTGDWSINGSTLSITVDNVTDDATIIELTNNSLILNVVESQTTTEQGITIVSTTDVTLSFTKM